MMIVVMVGTLGILRAYDGKGRGGEVPVRAREREGAQLTVIVMAERKGGQAWPSPPGLLDTSARCRGPLAITPGTSGVGFKQTPGRFQHAIPAI